MLLRNSAADDTRGKAKALATSGGSKVKVENVQGITGKINAERL